ncbi:MAG: hypothetical protein ACKPKO_05230, partial [Candidatus Fonsibacter sp.]
SVSSASVVEAAAGGVGIAPGGCGNAKENIMHATRSGAHAHTKQMLGNRLMSVQAKATSHDNAQLPALARDNHLALVER